MLKGNNVLIIGSTGAKTQTFWWALWRRFRWQNAANTSKTLV